jgi:hypothetical protein
MEIGQARVTFRGGCCSGERAGNIARLALQHLGRMTAGSGFSPSARVVGRVEVAPIRLPLGSMSDDAVARAVASQIVRTLVTPASPTRRGD